MARWLPICLRGRGKGETAAACQADLTEGWQRRCPVSTRRGDARPKNNGLAIARKAVEETGGRTWARTKDPLIKSQLLYQLSYASSDRGRSVSEEPPRDREARL
ncbi:hypothetical protein SPHINGO8AM_120023 [Sphingomonas sp. 8AM]|nr:hypothetical protein SPHINGO8AM_120023 [Sphingomonas sp. 8AM]